MKDVLIGGFLFIGGVLMVGVTSIVGDFFLYAGFIIGFCGLVVLVNALFRK